MKTTEIWRNIAIPVTTLLLTASPAIAQTEANRIAELEAKMSILAEQLTEMRAELDRVKQTGADEDMRFLRDEVAATKQIAVAANQSANEWKNTTSVMHVAGYGSAGFVQPQNGGDTFIANFNPIFHFQYGDRLLWESELETEIGDDGETEMGLEYSTIDFFLNDNLIFVAGKFISPIGNFRQNTHPSWINKLASAPPGFGHDGAAPLAEIGLQLRGGANFGKRSKVTYAGYVGVGPRLEGEGGEIHGINTGGFVDDSDDQKVTGGRLSVLPFPRLEIGVSGAFGDAAVAENSGVEIVGDPLRNYRVLGADASYRWESFEFRGEYVSQDVADSAQSIAPEGGKWATWYAQGAYKFAKAKWEGVLRYTDYTTPHPDLSQEQWAFGVNYLVTPNAILKLGYEFNNGLAGEVTDDDVWNFQIAYGY